MASTAKTLKLIPLTDINVNCSDDQFRPSDYEKFACYATEPYIVLKCNRFLTQRKIFLIHIGSWSITKDNFLEMPKSIRETTFIFLNHFYTHLDVERDLHQDGHLDDNFVASLLPTSLDSDYLQSHVSKLLCQLLNQSYISSNEMSQFTDTYIETLNIEYYECLSDEKFVEYYDKTIPVMEKEIADLEGKIYELNWVLSDKKQQMKHIPVSAMKTRYADLTRPSDISNGKSEYRFSNEREALIKQKLAIEQRLSELN